MATKRRARTKADRNVRDQSTSTPATILVETASVRALVKGAVRRMLTESDHFQGLAISLGELGDMVLDAEPAELRKVAITARAIALQANISVTGVVEAAELLLVVAEIEQVAVADACG